MDWKSITNVATDKMQSFVSIVTANNYNDFMDRDKDNFKVILITNKKSIPPIYKALSKYKDNFSYGLIRESESLAKEFKPPQIPAIGVITGRYDYSVDYYDGEQKLEKIKDFLRQYTGGQRKVSKSGQQNLIELNDKSMKNGLCDKQESKF